MTGTDFVLNLPKNVRYIIKTLEDNGYTAYAVGGCVRDAVLGRVPNDWDICTSARPEITKQLFLHKKLVLSGLKHGTVGIIMSGEVYETTTFRVEGEYKDHRRPDSVEFVEGVEGDLSRRDFTINAMAYSDTQGLIDLFGGRSDLEKGIIRCVGDPEKRFSEDALRILRALRFAARFGFEVENATKTAAIKLSPLLDAISAERKTAELKGILCVKDPCLVIEDFLPIFSRLFSVGEGELIKRSALLKNVPPVFALRLGILVRAEEILKNMKLSGAEMSVAIAAAQNVIKEPPQDLAGMRRMVMRLGDLCEPMLAVMGARCDVSFARTLLEHIRKNHLCCTVKELDITGRELITLGFSGADIGGMLGILLDEVIEGKITNEKDILVKRALALKQI